MNKDGNKQRGLYSWHEVLMLQALNRLLLSPCPPPHFMRLQHFLTTLQATGSYRVMYRYQTESRPKSFSYATRKDFESGSLDQQPVKTRRLGQYLPQRWPRSVQK